MNTDRPSPDEVIATALSDGDPSHSRGHPTPDGRGRLPPVNTRRVTVVDSRTWLVHMPLAEARHLAGTGHGWPASPQMRLAAALREWVAGISRRRTAVVPVRKVVADLTLILETVPLPQWPVCGPFGPGRAGTPLSGEVAYLGGGIVRLDGEALRSLASLAPGDDFRVTHTNAGPVLSRRR